MRFIEAPDSNSDKVKSNSKVKLAIRAINYHLKAAMKVKMLPVFVTGSKLEVANVNYLWSMGHALGS